MFVQLIFLNGQLPLDSIGILLLIDSCREYFMKQQP